MYLILIEYIVNYSICLSVLGVLPQWLSGKESACNAEDTGDVGLILGSGRSPGGGKDNPLQYSCLENPMDRGAWQATVHRVAKSQTRLSDFIHTHTHKPADGHCSHQSKRCLLLGRKAMTNLDGILKSRDITLPTKVHLVKAMVFPVVMHGCESWTVKKAEHQRTDPFELWC